MTIGAEIAALRSRYEKHFETDVPGHRVALIGSAPLHYQHKLGGWDDVANLLSQAGGFWGTHNVADPISFEDGAIVYRTAGGAVYGFTLTEIRMADASTGNSRRLALVAGGTLTRLGQRGLRWDAPFAGVSIDMVLQERGIKERINLASPLSLPDPASFGYNPATTYIVLCYAGVLPFPLRDAVTGLAIANGYNSQNGLTIRNAAGNTVLNLPCGPVLYGKRGRLRTRYVRTAAIPLGLAVPYTLLANPAVYPVMIDPTVDKPTSASGDDGYIGRTDGAASYVDTANAAIKVEGLEWEDEEFNWHQDVVRAVWRVDLSSLTGNTCNSATAYAKVTNNFGNSWVCDFYTLTADPGVLNDADFDAAATFEAGQQVAANNAWNSWAVDAARVEAKFGGYIGFRMKRSDTELGNYNCHWFAYDDAGGANEPYLHVDYSPSGATVTPSALAAAPSTPAPVVGLNVII